MGNRDELCMHGRPHHVLDAIYNGDPALLGSQPPASTGEQQDQNGDETATEAPPADLQPEA